MKHGRLIASLRVENQWGDAMARKRITPEDAPDAQIDTPIADDSAPVPAADNPPPFVEDAALEQPDAAQDMPQSAPPLQARPKTALHLAIGAAVALGAAGLGYGAALQFPLAGGGGVNLAPLEAEIAALKSQMAAMPKDDLAMRLAKLEAAPNDAAALTARLTALEAAINAIPKPDPNLAAELADIRARVAQTDPAPAIKAAIAAEIGLVQDSAAAMVAEVQMAAAQAVTLAAQTSLRSALDTGAPYAAAASTLPLPPLLAQYAETGIPSLGALKDSFPDAARAGLEAALRADMGQTWGERVGNFLRSQTGARALTPREGTDPDAILSRVEAALRSANLQAALTEAASLPDAAKGAMAPWIAAAQLRADALAAFDSLIAASQTAKGN